ncbi:hypothetical protein KKD04_00075 [Patescibacteria group bacterium]|nr:hypothetical protein [Patescibacteria group bacterium]
MLSAIQFIPQVIKSLKTKETKDVSLLTFLIIIAAASSWIIHGIHKSDIIIIIANILALVSALIIVILKIAHRK